MAPENLAKPADPLRIVLKAFGMTGLEKTIEPVFRDIDTTYVLHHNNLSCLCD